MITHWKRRFPWLAAWLLLLPAQSFAPSRVLETYRARHRPAAELVHIAETGLGTEGQVTLDVRTATLILNGSPAAVRRALSLLEQVDRQLRSVVLNSRIEEQAELDRLGIDVEWSVSAGPMRIGRLPVPPEGGENAFRLSAEGRREASRTTSRSRLKVLEGSSGVIRTGSALPFVYQPYWGARAVELLPLETGLEATATILGDGRVRIDFHPFSGRIESGNPRYTMAASSVTLSPGETMVIAGTESESESSERDLTGGSRRRNSGDTVILVTVAIEEP